MMYTVSPRGDSSFEMFTVEASGYNEAASIAVKQLCGRGGGVRLTGEFGRSGVFQGYVNIRGTTDMNSVGGNFHVREQ